MKTKKNRTRNQIEFPKITGIYLRNFQAIEGPAKIDIGNITILVGPNSVGKSAVHEAVEFFKSILDANISLDTALAMYSRLYERLDGDNDPLCAVGVEVEITPAIAEQFSFNSAAENREGQSIFHWLQEDMKANNRNTILEMRLTFFPQAGPANDAQGKSLFPNNIGKIELFIDRNTEPFLKIGELDSTDFFDVIREYLPSDFSDLFSPDTLKPDISDNIVELRKDFKRHHELTESLDWSKSVADQEANRIISLFSDGEDAVDQCPDKPEMIFSYSKSMLDLRQHVSSYLKPDFLASRFNYMDRPYDGGSLLDQHVMSIEGDFLVHRGVYWNPDNKNREQRVSFSCNQNAIRAGQVENVDVYPKEPANLIGASKAQVANLAGILELFIDVFRSALHISHVPADRPIIQSNDPITLMDPKQWHLECLSGNPGQHYWPDYSNYPDGLPTKFINSTSTERALFFKGYEYALGEYAWHLVRQENPDSQQDETLYDFLDYRGIPKPQRDFPNEALKTFLGSMRRYEFRRSCYNTVPHRLNPEGHDVCSNSTCFHVYDKEQQKPYNFSDLGSGISFVFPILVSLGEARLSFVEQPELHLHPKAQYEIADVFIAAKNTNGSSIIETHSEQLILAVSNRIREHNMAAGADHVINPALSLSSDEVKIHYFAGNDTQDGTQITELPLTSDGSLVDAAWPDGFFNKNEASTLSRLRLFSETVELEEAHRRLPWVSRFPVEPLNIQKWILCAATVEMIDEMYPVVFPVYAQKIAEHRIQHKLIDPFKERYADKLQFEHWEMSNPICKYLKNRPKPPALGQYVWLLNDTLRDEIDIRKNSRKITRAFREFIQNEVSEEDRMYWQDQNFIDRIDELANVRNGSSHANDQSLNEARKIHDLLFEEDQPGDLLKTFFT